jgi:hypothetical protein
VAKARPYDWSEKIAANQGRGSDLRPPPWDWRVEVRGALALDAAGEAAPPRLKREPPFATVARVAHPHATGIGAPAQSRARTRARTRKLRRLALAALAAAVVLPILILALDSASPAPPVPVAPADRVLPGGPPTPHVLAFRGELRLYLPIAETLVTAIGYHSVGESALALDPVGTQANAGVFTRLLRRVLGEDKAGIRYNLMGGGSGPETAGLDIGAPAGTDVYAPVDGTVIAISDRVVDGRRFGVRVDVQPAGSPDLVVSLTNLRADEALSVGSTVAASRTKIGSIVDLSSVESPTLAQYMHGEGQHVHVEVRPTASVSLP